MDKLQRLVFAKLLASKLKIHTAPVTNNKKGNTTLAKRHITINTLLVALQII